ncbi:hypothetical protein ACFFUT_01525 [Pseudohalocynthiibacter aestuariivivens]|uniref:Uncharacterized protein n=1 Tax=Pseudohalocynthiibacter aestuariivivens TaxID=1591409 RepID=A0ABV5JCK3_9RHOB|nr:MULTISPECIES: hypothetical protein [Pseudohalocynthiibacter]MBS9715978.1 hypothetical protein [Pseudohalocynthiibacter aestuariivivens]MCK0102465.1 hypothetical protein [Pseudohalocynthiibacter sp. F2068]
MEDIVGIISDSAEDPEIVECESNSIVYVGVSEIMKNANNISSPYKFEFDGITMELSDVGVSINSTREQEAVVLTIINSLDYFKSIWVWWRHPLGDLVSRVCFVLIVSVFYNYLANFFGESTADTEFVILFFLASILTLLLIWPVLRVIAYLLSSKVTRKKIEVSGYVIETRFWFTFY